jgi:hypothetical protein
MEEGLRKFESESKALVSQVEEDVKHDAQVAKQKIQQLEEEFAHCAMKDVVLGNYYIWYFIWVPLFAASTPLYLLAPFERWLGNLVVFAVLQVLASAFVFRQRNKVLSANGPSLVAFHVLLWLFFIPLGVQLEYAIAFVPNVSFGRCIPVQFNDCTNDASCTAQQAYCYWGTCTNFSDVQNVLCVQNSDCDFDFNAQCVFASTPNNSTLTDFYSRSLLLLTGLLIAVNFAMVIANIIWVAIGPCHSIFRPETSG